MENQEKYQAEHVEHKKGAPIVMIVSTIILTLGLIAWWYFTTTRKAKWLKWSRY